VDTVHQDYYSELGKRIGGVRTEKLKLYQQIGVNSSPIKITIPQIFILENIEEISKALLQITVTKPELSDCEKILLDRSSCFVKDFFQKFRKTS
jgi:hypothetical protein